MRKLAIMIGVAALALRLKTDAVDAFCGFYVSGTGTKMFNDATQVVLMRDGTRTVLSMQNSYQGPLEDFAMVVPVPVVLKEAEVKTLPDGVFDRSDQLGARGSSSTGSRIRVQIRSTIASNRGPLRR